ncbi:MAG: UDP-3-O-(3-hydroxymyristoyl)glucosamine N-acyltransferase, partial [Spirochaetota bacterium]|nr:UDP-3-O-(3-hydroxymyristoyl)glucosamine N-acyltransferase [Spirochaetota bacterium]
GSCILGDNVVLAGQVGIADHLTLGNNVTVLGQSGVTHSITAGEVVMGFPAKPVKEARKILASLSRLYNKKKI